MAAIDPKGTEKYYINGEVFQGIRLAPTKVGQEKYYVNGEVEKNLTPLTNKDTGKFFALFD